MGTEQGANSPAPQRLNHFHRDCLKPGYRELYNKTCSMPKIALSISP